MSPIRIFIDYEVLQPIWTKYNGSVFADIKLRDLGFSLD
jgi:hypothetical protein